MLGRSSEALAVLALDLALDVAIADLATAVALFLATRQRQLDLRPRALEVDPRWDQGQAAPLTAPDQTLDLVAM